jgi:hypothetical protein
MLHCCFLRRQLAEEFAIASRRYAESVVRLTRLGFTEAEYLNLAEQAVQAQHLSEAASAAFEEHVDSHRCFNGDTDKPSPANETKGKENSFETASGRR